MICLAHKYSALTNHPVDERQVECESCDMRIYDIIEWAALQMNFYLWICLESVMVAIGHFNALMHIA